MPTDEDVMDAFRFAFDEAARVLRVERDRLEGLWLSHKAGVIDRDALHERLGAASRMTAISVDRTLLMLADKYDRDAEARRVARLEAVRDDGLDRLLDAAHQLDSGAK